MTIWIMLCIAFPAGLLIGLCLGYFRLAQWYQQRTGNNLWEEARKGEG